jgi:dolichol-phosphate mannosyltransferase/undecaprenyl-phosphate 4-deoxy-4-formamido-L-arabinose transferase
MSASDRDSVSSVHYSVVIPVFRSEETIEELYHRLTSVMRELNKTYELIFVEDAGGDSSWTKLERLAHDDEHVAAIQLTRNFGQAGATNCGLHYATGDIIVTIDDDLQHPPEEIPVLIQTLERDPDLDVALGAPRVKQHKWWRTLGSKTVNYVSNRILSRGRSLTLTSFRAIRKQALEQALALTTTRPALGAMLLSITPRVVNVPVDHHPRMHGRGNYSLAKLVGLTVDKTLSYSTFPLRLLAVVGGFGILASATLAGYYLWRYAVGGIAVPGWLSQTLILIVISGFNFLAFGIVGEYLLRILQAVHGMPTFLVREIQSRRETHSPPRS